MKKVLGFCLVLLACAQGGEGTQIVIVRHGESDHNVARIHNTNPAHPRYTVSRLTEEGKAAVILSGGNVCRRDARRDHPTSQEMHGCGACQASARPSGSFQSFLWEYREQDRLLGSFSIAEPGDSRDAFLMAPYILSHLSI